MVVFSAERIPQRKRHPGSNDGVKSRLTSSSISISLIYLVASRTSWLSQDPMLWFTMMLMPTGPPALKLTALAEVDGSSEDEKLSIAKFLCVSSSCVVFDVSRLAQTFLVEKDI